MDDTDTDADTDTDDNTTRRTEHDYIGSFPNEPTKSFFISLSPKTCSEGSPEDVKIP